MDPGGAIEAVSLASSADHPSSPAGVLCGRQRWANGDRQCLSNTSIRRSRVLVRLAGNLATAPDLNGPASFDNETIVEMDGARTQADIREVRSSTEVRPSDMLVSEGASHRPRGKTARMRVDHVRAVQDWTHTDQNRFMRRWTQTTYPIPGTSHKGATRVIAMRKGKSMRGRYDPTAYAYSPRH